MKLSTLKSTNTLPSCSLKIEISCNYQQPIVTTSHKLSPILWKKRGTSLYPICWSLNNLQKISSLLSVKNNIIPACLYIILINIKLKHQCVS
jgi:hypothetical protein